MVQNLYKRDSDAFPLRVQWNNFGDLFRKYSAGYGWTERDLPVLIVTGVQLEDKTMNLTFKGLTFLKPHLNQTIDSIKELGQFMEPVIIQTAVVPKVIIVALDELLEQYLVLGHVAAQFNDLWTKSA